MTQQNAETNDSTFRLTNSVSSTKRVYMRNKDMADYEKELETSRLNSENPEEDPASENDGQPENPTSVENPKSVDWQKRYSDAQSHFTKEINLLKGQITGLTQTISEKDQKLKEVSKPTYPTSQEELEEWAKQFPPLYNIMRTIVLKEKDVESEEIKQKFKELDELKQSLANEKGRTELLKLHPDASDFDAGGSRNAEFAQWFDEQEPEIKALIESGIPSKIGKAISIFKKDKGIVTQSAQTKQREASKAVNVGPTQKNLPKEQRVWRESEVSRLTPKQYELYEPEIEQARMQGRYVRDLTT